MRKILQKTCFLLMALLLCAVSWAQNKVVTGKIVDGSGNGIVGASVLAKGTNIGTSADQNGNFSISVSESVNVLEISAVNYFNKTVEISTSPLYIILQPANSDLADVVVIGYGTKKKKDLTTAISSVSSQTLGKLSITRVDDALQGNASGVMVLNQNGQPGSQPMVRIRGTGTNTDPNPLYIVDGFPVDNIEYINPGDIERIDVLKDAASTAIYGARGANGVILVTTKTGKAGKSIVTYDAYYGTQNAWRKVPELNATQYATMMNTGSLNANPANPVPYADPASFGAGTNWQDALFQKNVPVASHQLSASGGNDKSNYLASFSYLDQQGVIGGKNSDFTRYTGRLNLNQKLTSFLKVGTNLNYIHSQRAAIFDNGDQGGQALGNAFNIDPITPVYETDATKLANY